MSEEKGISKGKTKRMIKEAIDPPRSLLRKLKENHLVMMILCCVIPLVAIWGIVAVFGASKSYLYWTFLALCPLSHWFMMKEMHKDRSHDEKGKEESKAKKQGGNCH